MLHTFRRIAELVAAWSLATVFGLFVYGIVMRYGFDRPIGWVDEAVTLLSVWCTFWTAAFVLRWHEHIAFDVVYARLSPERQRLSLLIGGTLFAILMGAAMPGMIDYTQFLWRERTDSMQLRLDYVYAVFPLFFAVILLRLLWSMGRLISARWRSELDVWAGNSPTDQAGGERS